MPAASVSFPAAKALAWDFDLLPIVNSKKQYIGVVFRTELESLINCGEDAQEELGDSEVPKMQSRKSAASKNSGTDSAFKDSQEFLDLWASDDEEGLAKDKAALERTIILRKTGLVIYSKQMLELVELCLRVAKVDSTVLISGESGVGKELLAKLVHDQSPRSEGPFIKINCGAIPENLLESELFGYEPGAFTGASKQGKPGMFELASGGTLFLDEIGELPLSLQVKLLRAIQEQEFVRVGGVKPKKVDIRFVAATNRDLEKMVVEGQFRDDLYYRLNVIPVLVPPLRERKEDILPLVHHFQQKMTARFQMERNFAPEVMRVFLDYPWLGNVRELENIIERLFVTSPGNVIRLANLPERMLKSMKQSAEARKVIPLKEALQQTERRLIAEAIAACGNTYRAAEALGIDQSTLIRKKAKLLK